MVIREIPASGKFKLQMYNMPEIKNDDSILHASDNNIGKRTIDGAPGNFDADPEDEMVQLRAKTDGRQMLLIFDVPDTIGGETTLIASDKTFGVDVVAIAAGNFDADPEDEVAAIRRLADGSQRLLIYDGPGVIKGDVTLIASDKYIGTNVTDFAAGNFDADPQDELALVRTKGDGRNKLMIYDVPTVKNGEIVLIASDNNVGYDVAAIAAGDSHSTAGTEVTLLRLIPASGKHKVQVYQVPDIIKGETTQLASDKNIGKDILAIGALASGSGAAD